MNFAGKSSQILGLFVRGEIEVYTSPFILRELEAVLKEKFEWDAWQISRALGIIKEKAIEVQPQFRLSVIKEKEDDNRFLNALLKERFII